MLVWDDGVILCIKSSFIMWAFDLNGKMIASSKLGEMYQGQKKYMKTLYKLLDCGDELSICYNKKYNMLVGIHNGTHIYRIYMLNEKLMLKCAGALGELECTLIADTEETFLGLDIISQIIIKGDNLIEIYATDRKYYINIVFKCILYDVPNYIKILTGTPVYNYSRDLFLYKYYIFHIEFNTLIAIVDCQTKCHLLKTDDDLFEINKKYLVPCDNVISFHDFISELLLSDKQRFECSETLDDIIE